MPGAQTRKRYIQTLLVFFILALTASGLTAIPLPLEISILNQLFGSASSIGQLIPPLGDWISFVHEGLVYAQAKYPFLAYGTDWLAFAHVVIAVAFIGPLRDPVKNIWVIEFGMIACLLIIPWALVFGLWRGIPVFWRLVDMSFGVAGLVLLWFARKEALRLERGV